MTVTNHQPETDQPASEQQAVEQAPELEGPWTEGQIRFLKRAIAVMSTILVAGLALVIGRIVYLAGETDRANPSSAALPMAPGKLATTGQLTLPPGSTIRNMSLSGHRLAVHFSGANGDGIAIVNLISGKAVSTIKIIAVSSKE